MLGAVAWGLAGASTIAVILEVVGAVVAVILLLVGLRLAGQGNLLTQGGDILGDSTALGCSALQSFFANPLVPGGLILALGVAVPWIEEPAKSLAVVLLRNRLGTARDAFLYGVAAGVGFGMLESAIYNVGDVHTWWGTATLRLGTSFIHALATGLFGVAWFYRLQRRDRGRFWRYAFAGTAVHGLWNASVVVIITLSVFRVCSTDPIALLTSTDPARYVAVLIPAILWAGAALALVLLARRLGPAEPATGLTPPTGSADPARG